MLDINVIREQTERVRSALARRHDTAPIDEILAADATRRELIQEVEALRRLRNQASKQIGSWLGMLRKLEADMQRAEAANDVDRVNALRAQLASLEFNADEARDETRRIGEQIADLEGSLREVEARLQEHMLWVPNLPDASVPDGPNEEANLRHPPQGPPPPSFDFEPAAHWDLGPALDIIDFERGVQLSGSRFYLLKRWGARLQHALIQFMLDTHVRRNGYTEIYPPFIARSAMFEAAGQLPKFYDNLYRDAEEDFMLLATAEIALTNLHRDEIVDESRLPFKYVAYTPCFRREKMSAGKDVRGIKRGHQFDKVEIYQFTRPEDSFDALEQMKEQAIDICQALGFPYRVVELATGDLGFASAKTYDIEIWAAGCAEWLEVSSASNCLDFQSRRANARFRREETGRPEFMHTLNASGLALPRVMIAVLENNQRADGSVVVPEPLRPYMGGLEVITPPV